MSCVLAFDLGASSGRAILGRLDDGKLSIEEIHRFPNESVQVGDHLYWDILRLFQEIKQGILKAKNRGVIPDSIAIDSWAVDYGLLNETGELMGNPYHYRDHRTDGMMEKVFSILPKEELFSRTGIQFLPFNTIFQLYATHKRNPKLLNNAKHFLMIPDLLRYFLTGEIKNEFSNATTTQFFNPTLYDWDRALLQKIGIPVHLLGEIVSPGTMIGQLRSSIRAELGVPAIPVIAVAEHDTGSAVAAVPALEEDFIYLSCGTWSLIGTEIKYALINEHTFSLNFTNEGGFNQTYRLLKNIMGLWIIQECRKVWEKEGVNYTFENLVNRAAQAEPWQYFIDPDDLMFLNPEHMPKQIQQYCSQTNQKIPCDEGSIIRCVLESLAFKYRYVFERTERITSKTYRSLYMVGGGIHNTLLCQFTANALNRCVLAGPTEASAIGNIAVQLITLGEITNIREGREIVHRSFAVETYYPENPQQWEEGYQKFLKVTNL